MKSFLRAAALVAVGCLSTANAQDSINPQQPTQSPASGVTERTPSALGCFSDPGSMWDMGPYTFQTNGWCQPLCVRQGATYFGLVNGTNCFCGNSSPDSSKQVSSSECDTTCNGYNSDNCGGQNRWAIYADDYRNGDSTGTIAITTPTQTWFGHSATTTASTLATSVSGANNQKSTVVVTANSVPTSTQAPSTSSGPNKAAIAAGVVVGVVGLVALIGAAVFFLRQRKRRELEEERRRHQSIINIVNKGEKPPSAYSASDSRLEPSVMFQRRQSDGSIMDNQDYSRRILKVTNPDGR